MAIVYYIKNKVHLNHHACLASDRPFVHGHPNESQNRNGPSDFSVGNDPRQSSACCRHSHHARQLEDKSALPYSDQCISV